jgi:PTH1 family peptidyl-tRNA hydrolase
MQDEGSIKFVVGLGNPGRQYASTRHNVGFLVLAELVRRWAPPAPRDAFSGRLWDVRMRRGDLSRRVMLLAPMTFMNRSGQAVQELTAFYKAPPPDVLVVLDDMALPLGRLRARAQGSAGGHNGLADVIRALGSDQTPRLRVGIGARPDMIAGRDYVLTGFAPGEKPVVAEAVELAASAVEDWALEGIELVMRKYNRSDKDSKDSKE